MKKLILLLIAVFSLSACSTFDRVFPSTKDEYKQAEAMPDLEIPPDLTKDSINDMMAIPGEGATATASGASTEPAAPKQAQIQTIDGRSVVAIPEALTTAWTRIEQTLAGSGLAVDAKDQAKGTFNVTYTDETRSWFQSLLHGNENEYVISLTGAGDKTELALLDDKGESSPTEESDRILSTIMTQYNISYAQ